MCMGRLPYHRICLAPKRLRLPARLRWLPRRWICCPAPRLGYASFPMSSSSSIRALPPPPPPTWLRRRHVTFATATLIAQRRSLGYGYAPSLAPASGTTSTSPHAAPTLTTTAGRSSPPIILLSPSNLGKPPNLNTEP
jgi:hypothetical protein